MTGSDKSHLSQRDLAEIDGIDDIMKKLGETLEAAKFEEGKNKGQEYCVDKHLPQALEPLFTALDLKEVRVFHTFHY